MNLHPGQKIDLEKLQRECNLTDAVRISAAIKFNKSRVYKGVIAKPGHLWIKSSCEWNGKYHWKIREINVSILSDIQLKDMFEQLKSEMLKEVGGFVG